MEDGNDPAALAGADRREAETALGRAGVPRVDRATHALLLEFSHELRGKLNAINGWADVLEGCVTGNELAERGLEVIKRNAAAQAKIIRDMLDRVERAVEPLDTAVESASDPPLRAASGSRSGR